MKKKKIVIHSNFSRAFTGFGKHTKNLLKYLYKLDKYEIVEFANGLSWNDKQVNFLPWKCYGSLPNDPERINQLNKDPNLGRAAGYGAEMVDEIIKREKPDVYVGIEDIWGFNNYWNRKWWNKPNMRLRVNKKLVKLGKNEKEMSEALQTAIIAGATKLGAIKNPKKKGGSKRNKPSNDKRVGAAVNKQKQSPIALKNLINSVLPQAVAMKMQPPALRYRTGRFANSARVTQVLQGPRGGLQADYTYMRDPYETFEPGGKMGSVQRDPRKIIGQTIREIVAQGMQNKFIKTRRV